MATRPGPDQEGFSFSDALRRRREGERPQEAPEREDPLDFSGALRRRRGRDPRQERQPAPRDTTPEPPTQEEESLFDRFLSFFEREGEPEGLGAEVEEERETVLEPLQAGSLSPGAQEDLLEAGPEVDPDVVPTDVTGEAELERALHEELERQGMADGPAPSSGLERTPGGSLYDPATGEIVSLTPVAGPPTSLQRTETEPEPGVRDIVTREEQMAASPELQEARRRVGDTSSDVALSIGRNWAESGMATGIGLTELLGLEGAEEDMRRTREELRDYYGEAETTAGRIAGGVARFAGDLSQFIAPELALTRLGALPAKVSTLRRIGREVALGAPLDAVIAASDEENSLAGFVNRMVQEGELPEEWKDDLEDIAQTPWKRALFDSFVGSLMAAGLVGTLDLVGRGIDRVRGGSAAEGEELLREARIRSVTDDYRQAAQEPGGLETVPLGVEDLEELDPDVLRGVATDLERKLQQARRRGIVDAATERDLSRIRRALREGTPEQPPRARGGGAPQRPRPGAGGRAPAGEIGPQRGRESLESGVDVSGPAPRSLEAQEAELREAMEARIRGLEEESGTDPLTELPNRRGEQRALERRPPAEDQVRVQFMADVDNFKAVNDRLGQEAGDEYLRELSRILEAVAREEDAVTLARIGGDEFRVTVDARAGTDPEALRQRFNRRVNEELAERGMDRVEDMPLGVTFFEPGEKAAAKMEAGRSRPRFQVERRPPPADLAPPEAREAAIRAAAQGDVEAIRSVEAALTEAGDRGRRPAIDAEVGPRGEMPSSDVFALQRGDIDLDPERFQYKIEGRQAAGRALEGVDEWDYSKAGVMSVWWDEEAGQWFVVNGHNRMGLANRVLSDDEPVNVIELHAPNPRAARAMGAMQNIAEGRGTAIDAAKFFRDAGLDAEGVAELNIPLTENRVQRGLALANLHPAIFDDVVQKRIKVNRAVIIGESGLEPEHQLAIHQSEEINDLNQGELEELIRMAQGAGTRETTQETLFGTETFRESNLLERVKISRRVKRELRRDKRIFGPLAKESRAQRIEQKGVGQVKSEEAGKIATEAERFEEVYESLSTGSGPVVDILNRHARAVGAGEESLADAAEAATEEVKDALRQFIEEGNLTAEVRRADEAAEGVRAADRGGEGARPAGDGEGVPGGRDPDRPEAQGEARGVEAAPGEPISSDLAAQIDRGEVISGPNPPPAYRHQSVPEGIRVVRIEDPTDLSRPGFVVLDDDGRMLTVGGEPGRQVFDSAEDAFQAARSMPATEDELAGILEGAVDDPARTARSLQNTRTGRLLSQFDKEIRQNSGGLTPLARAQLQELASRGEDVTNLLSDAGRRYDTNLYEVYQNQHQEELTRLINREQVIEKGRPTDLGPEGADDLELFERAARAYDAGDVPEELARTVREWEADRARQVFGSEEAADRVAEETIQMSLDFTSGTVDGAPVASRRLRTVQEGAQRRAWVDIREKVLETPEDVHRALFPFRHPKAERLHYIYVDEEGRVLGHTMDTAGAINTAGTNQQHSRAVWERANRLGASEVIVAHNHPSGDPYRSKEDIRFLMGMRVFFHTQDEARRLRSIATGPVDPEEMERRARAGALAGLETGSAAPSVDVRRGYIIDHDEIHELELHGPETAPVPEALVKDRTHAVDPPTRPEDDWTFHRGRKVTRPRHIADMVGREDRPAAVDLVLMDTQNRVVAVEPHGSDFLADPQRAAEAIEQRARAHGSGNAIIVTHGAAEGDYWSGIMTANRLRRGEQYQTAVRDVIAVEPGGNRYTAAAEGSSLEEIREPELRIMRVFERNLPPDEEVAQAAVFHPGRNEWWTGRSHFEALEKVPDDVPTGELVDGYETTNGRFVDRKEALGLEEGAADVQFGTSEEIRRSPSRAARQRAEDAKEYFGTTRDAFEAGYITRDGSMLDFSGKRFGGSPGVRHMDHREINEVYDRSFPRASDPLYRFMREGNIRVTAYDNLLRAGVRTNVTKHQVEALKDMAGQILEASGDDTPTLHLLVRDQDGGVVAEIQEPMRTRSQVAGEIRTLLRKAEEAGYDTSNLRKASTGRDIPEGLSDGDVVAPKTYPSAPRSIATDQANRIRDIAQGLKEGEPQAVEEAAEQMAPKMTPGARLIPVPDHTGNTEANRKLAFALARRLKGEVADVLARVPNEESSFVRRRAGEPGLTADEIEHELVKPAGDLENAYLVDNVVTTGATATSARRALGEEVPVAAYAKDASVEHRRRLELQARQGGRQVREDLGAYGEVPPEVRYKVVQRSQTVQVVDRFAGRVENKLDMGGGVVREFRVDQGREDAYKEAYDRARAWIRQQSRADDQQHYRNMEVEEYEGRVGDRTHMTRQERGTIDPRILEPFGGARGEARGAHTTRSATRYRELLEDIRENGIQEPIFVVVEPHGRPVIQEGNNRLDVALELGLEEVPVHVRYFGKAEVRGNLAKRSRQVRVAEQTDLRLRESSEAYGRAAGLRPAIRVEGRIFEGRPGELHVDVLRRMSNDDSSKAIWAEERGEGAAGWVDQEGNWLTRAEAADRLEVKGDLHADMLDDQGRIEDTLKEAGDRYGQEDLFGGTAPAEGGDQFQMFGRGERALEGLSASEERARETVMELQGAVDRQTATPEQMERYNDAVKLLRRDYPVQTDELIARARQAAAENPPRPDAEGQTDIFGPEAGAALPKVLRSIAGAGAGGTVGALLDEENPWRGAAIGAVVGGALVEVPGAWTDVMAGRKQTLADRVEQAAQAAARGEPPGAPHYRGTGRTMTEEDLERAVNFEKFDLDPTGQQRLEEEIKRVGAETGVKDPHKVVTMEEAEALARRLALDPEDVLPQVGERMTGVELTALGNIVVDNVRKTTQMLEALNHPALTREQEEVLLRNIRTREAQNNVLLDKILRGRSQKGRDLGQLKLTAMGVRGDDGLLEPEPFYVQAKRFLGEEAFTTEHAARINDFIARDDVAGLAEYIASLRSHSTFDKVVTFYKANLMSAPITQIRNLAGNTSMAILETVKDAPAWVGDRLLSMAFDTGLTTKTVRPTRLAQASWEGIKKGAREAEQVLRTGVRIDDAAIKYDLTRAEVSFNNIFLDVYTKAIFRGMLAGDRLFKGVAFMRALDEMAQITALNEGLERGSEAFKTRVAELLKAPTDEMAAQAIHDAEIATFTNRNVLGDIGVNIKRRVPLMEGVIPFTNTPANIAMRTVDYTPFGFLRTAKGAFELSRAVAQGIQDAGTRRQVLELQRHVANNFGRNVVGSLGLAALGYKLAEAGVMTGNWPSDRRTQREWQRRGIPSNGVYIPEGTPGIPEDMQGTWGTIENISPWGNIMAFGANVYNVVANPETSGWTDVLAGAGVSIATTVSEQSFLTGLSESLAALNNPERASGDAFRRTVASFLIPNILKKVSEGFDPTFREAETLGEEIGRRLPPALQRGPLEVPPAMDVFGRDIERQGGVLKSLFDPFNTRTDEALEDEVIMELSRVGASVPELQREEEETREEFRRRRRRVGQRLYAGIRELVTSGPYRAIPEVTRQAIEQNARLQGELDPEAYARDLQQGLIEDLVSSIKRGETRRMKVEEAFEGLNQREEVPSGGR